MSPEHTRPKPVLIQEPKPKVYYEYRKPEKGKKQPTLSKRNFLKLATLAGAAGVLEATRRTLVRQEEKEIVIPKQDFDSSQVTIIAENKAIPEKLDINTGRELLDSLGLSGKVVYLVYGRPNGGWGSLGRGRTAEQSWIIAKISQAEMAIAIRKPADSFAFTMPNAVYNSDNKGNNPVKDIYVEKALELAPLHNGLVALDFSNTDYAKEIINNFENKFPPEKMVYLAVSLDAEHFPDHQLEAEKINEFSAWYAEKHKQWRDKTGRNIPGFVFIYTFGGGRILNLNKLQQYYFREKTLVVPIFDGFGTYEGKIRKMVEYIRTMKNTETDPALLGVMEFYKRWNFTFDKIPPERTFDTLRGAPCFIFASQ